MQLYDAPTDYSTPAQAPVDDRGLLKTIRDTCLTAIQAGLEEKDRVYTPGARECLRLYLNNHHRHLFAPERNVQENYALYVNLEGGGSSRRARKPMFQMDDNVAGRAVQIYVPFLLGEETVRTVEANKPFVPPPSVYGIVDQQITWQQYQAGNLAFVQQQRDATLQYQAAMQQIEMDYQRRTFNASMKQGLLNYTVKELGLRMENELAAVESIVLGGGAWITGIIDLPGGLGRLPGSTFVSMNDIVFDPDCMRGKDAKWLAIRFRFPRWLISRITGIPENEIKGTQSSSISNQQYKQLLSTIGNDSRKHIPKPQDEVEVWKFWSRMGCGARLMAYDKRDAMFAALDNQLSDFVYYLISDCCEYPLNLTPQHLAQMIQMSQQVEQMTAMGVPPQYDPVDIIRAATAWPVEYYLDQDDPWPITVAAFYHRTGSPYPIPLLEFCLSYIKFMIWCIGFIAEKTYRSNRDFIAVDEAIGEQLIAALESEEDDTIVKVKLADKKAVTDLIQYLSAPPLHKDILDVYAFFERKFQQASGMSDLLEAMMSRQMRSATEAQVIDQAARLRPDKMASDFDDAQRKLARKEAIAAHKLQGKDVAFLVGQPGAMAWDQMVQQTPIQEAFREASYKVEAFRGRKVSQQLRHEQTQEMVSYVLPVLLNFAMETGITDSVNGVLTKWAEARNIDPATVQLPTTQQLMQIQQQKLAQQQQMQTEGQMAVDANKAKVAPKKEKAA